MEFSVREIEASDAEWINEVVLGWGAEFIVSRGRKLYPQKLSGFVALDESKNRIGLLTYEITGDQCEVVTLDAFVKFAGIGTALMERMKKEAVEGAIRRLWLITINDNLDAIRFYQRRGMTISAIHINALENSRKLKPAIPLIGQHGIPMRDEIEFEIL